MLTMSTIIPVNHKTDKTQNIREKENSRSLPANQTGNGFLHMKQYLKEMSSIQNSLNTGRPLALCLREQVPPSLLTETTTNGAHSDKTTAADIAGCTMSMQHHALDLEEEETLRRLKFTRQDLTIEKLQWIYKLLCGLTNMRNKDLKTMVPLTCGYVNIIMKDTETTNIILKNSPRCLTLQASPEDYYNINHDTWESFINPQDQDLKSPSAKFGGCKLVPFGLRKKAGLKELETETGDLPTWLNLILDETFAYEKNPQIAKNKYDMLERVRTEFLDVQRSKNNQMETDIYDKKMHREERMRTMFNVLMLPRKATRLSILISSLKHELREPKSTTVFWCEILKRDTSELVDENNVEYRTILQKIGQFYNFSHKKLPYAKEKFCLLVISLPSNQLLRPAMQDALMFLTENVLQILPRQLKHWFQYLKLPLYDSIS
ncbi:uncharacterized protein LOC134018707 isoform X1 [Osmerus eperlanus]|uniref:uncharacterized protein LOC134018707 isoform X1 n=2 Tax=Osmerus eperlanus TaxID=29151 RepID=UPI002E15A249